MKDCLSKEQDNLLNVWNYLTWVGLKETRRFTCDMSIFSEFSEMFKEEKE